MAGVYPILRHHGATPLGPVQWRGPLTEPLADVNRRLAAVDRPDDDRAAARALRRRAHHGCTSCGKEVSRPLGGKLLTGALVPTNVWGCAGFPRQSVVSPTSLSGPTGRTVRPERQVPVDAGTCSLTPSHHPSRYPPPACTRPQVQELTPIQARRPSRSVDQARAEEGGEREVRKLLTVLAGAFTLWV